MGITSSDIRERFESLMLGKETDWDNLVVDDEGDLACARCGEKRTRHLRFPIAGRNIVSVECACMREEREKREEEERRNREEEDRIARENAEMERRQALRLAAGLGRDHLDMTYETFDRAVNPSIVAALDRSKRYCDSFEVCRENGEGILFTGPTGIGKTAIMACMVNELTIGHGASCYFTTITKLVESIFREGRESVMERVRSSDLLLIDDIGQESVPSDQSRGKFRQEVLFDVLNTREEDRAPVVFSSNLRSKEIMNGSGIDRATAYRLARLAPAVIEIQAGTSDNYRISLINQAKRRLHF